MFGNVLEGWVFRDARVPRAQRELDTHAPGEVAGARKVNGDVGYFSSQQAPGGTFTNAPVHSIFNDVIAPGSTPRRY
jgi:hypothetical protein